MSLMTALPQRARGGFPPDIETEVNSRWSALILQQNGMNVARLRLIGVDISTLASCVRLRLIDVQFLCNETDLDGLDVSEFNLRLFQLSKDAPAVVEHPGDLLGQCYHQQEACGCSAGN